MEFCRYVLYYSRNAWGHFTISPPAPVARKRRKKTVTGRRVNMLKMFCIICKKKQISSSPQESAKSLMYIINKRLEKRTQNRPLIVKDVTPVSCNTRCFLSARKAFIHRIIFSFNRTHNYTACYDVVFLPRDARSTSAVLLSYVVRPSVCPSVTSMYRAGT